MRKLTLTRIVLILASLALLAGLVYWIPPIHRRLSWRVDFALTYLRGIVRPAGAMPTALPQPRVMVTSLPTPSPTLPLPTATASNPATPEPTATPGPTATAIPPSIGLTAPAWEQQDINNCGPASLAIFLNFFGWKGDQFAIDTVVKPQREDRNVNVEELAYFARTQAGWLNFEYRVGGDLQRLKQILAAGMPVMIEETFRFEEPFWPKDDLWAAHYLLLTGYDDATSTFTGQDSFYGADRKVPYQKLDEYWQSFNRVYIMIYPPDQEPDIKAILGPDWDRDANRQRALQTAEAEAQVNPQNAFAWFNVGTNLVYFDRYTEAAAAYDTARNLGLPQRMLRYQFGPFLAYFNGGRLDDLLALTEYALQRTPNSEEALLWNGWGLYRKGKTADAITDWRKALQANSTYQDAKYALSFVGATP
jgi:tetratricopeptide (TPR) repeat protein